MSKAKKHLAEFAHLGRKEEDLTVGDVQSLIELARSVFRYAALDAGVEKRVVTAILTKFCDAGRRSPPTAAFSSILPGRPQSGSDGNRTKRWLLDKEHKFYAEEIPSTLVEVKYILEALSMDNAPRLPTDEARDVFKWLIGHEVMPGAYRDPIQLIPISFTDFCADRRLIQSGHIYPLDRGGRHEPGNAFLMLARSNQLQGNNTVSEMVSLMRSIADRHAAEPDYISRIAPDAHVKAEEAP
jgi:hypothetical protein